MTTKTLNGGSETIEAIGRVSKSRIAVKSDSYGHPGFSLPRSPNFTWHTRVLAYNKSTRVRNQVSWNSHSAGDIRFRGLNPRALVGRWIGTRWIGHQTRLWLRLEALFEKHVRSNIWNTKRATQMNNLFCINPVYTYNANESSEINHRTVRGLKT